MDYQIEEEVGLFIETSCCCTFFLSHTLTSRADYVSLKVWLEGCVALLALTAVFFIQQAGFVDEDVSKIIKEVKKKNFFKFFFLKTTLGSVGIF